MAAILSISPSSIEVRGAIDLQLPSSIQACGAIDRILPSRLNTSSSVAVHLASSFQQTSDRSSSPFKLPSSFTASRLTPEIGVDPLGNYHWVITPEVPVATQDPP